MEDWDADLSPCNFATTHFLQKEAVSSPCNLKFATSYLTAFILDIISLELRDPLNGGPFRNVPLVGNRPNAVSGSTVSNTELSEFFGAHWVPGSELSEFLSAYYLCAKANSPSVLQKSPSLPQNSVRLSEFSSPKQYSRNSIETVFRPFPNWSFSNDKKKHKNNFLTLKRTSEDSRGNGSVCHNACCSRSWRAWLKFLTGCPQGCLAQNFLFGPILVGKETTPKHKQICGIVLWLDGWQNSVYVLCWVIPYGGEKTNKQNPPPNPGTIPWIVCLPFVSKNDYRPT